MLAGLLLALSLRSGWGIAACRWGLGLSTAYLAWTLLAQALVMSYARDSLAAQGLRQVFPCGLFLQQGFMLQTQARRHEGPGLTRSTLQPVHRAEVPGHQPCHGTGLNLQQVRLDRERGQQPVRQKGAVEKTHGARACQPRDPGFCARHSVHVAGVELRPGLLCRHGQAHHLLQAKRCAGTGAFQQGLAHRCFVHGNALAPQSTQLTQPSPGNQHVGPVRHAQHGHDSQVQAPGAADHELVKTQHRGVQRAFLHEPQVVSA